MYNYSLLLREIENTTHAPKTRQLKRSKQVLSESVLKLSVAAARGNRQQKHVPSE